jgi:predicted thioesterase
VTAGALDVNAVVTAHNGVAEIGRGTVTRAVVNPAKVAEKHAKRHAGKKE